MARRRSDVVPVSFERRQRRQRAAGAAQTPGGELGAPGTVADLVRFLLSPQGGWIRGQLLLSNGGFATPAV